MYATDKAGNPILRPTDITLPVQLVQEGDLMFGIPVRFSEPESDYIWKIDAYTDDEQVGIRLLMTINHPVNVVRMTPLQENQCVECGREGVKYAAKRLCNACYQRQQRSARRESQSHHRSQGEQMSLI